jgi:pimeloyl-ACP methyl ester carboxylesterase
MINSQELEEKRTIINGLETNYKISGDGQPVLILHGWGGSSDSWIQVQKILAEKNFRVIIPDFPGFGKSKTPEEPWTVDGYVEWVKNFAERIEINSPIFLLGHSFGGRISIKFAIKYPEKIKSLILCSSAGIKPKGELSKKIFYYLARIGNYLFSQKPLARFKEGARNTFYTMIRKKDYLKANGVMKEIIKNILAEDLKVEL